MDIISRLPGCDGQAADAVSACTQVKMEDAPGSWKLPKSEYPDIRMCLPRHKWPKSWSNIEDPGVPLERNFYGHALAGLLWERQLEKVSLEQGWESTELAMFIRASKARSIPILHTWMTSKNGCKKKNYNFMWKNLMKLVDLGDPKSFLDHENLGCTQRECKSNESIIEEHNMFKSRISAEATEKLLAWENRTRKQSLGLTKWKVIRRNAWKDVSNGQKERLSNCIRSLLHALMTITPTRKNWTRLENCQE